MPADTLGRLMIDEPNGVWLRGLYDKLANSGAGDWVNNATGSWVIRAAAADGSYDANGALVSNGGGSFTYQTGSSGNYYGTIAANAALTAGNTYYVVATILDSDGNTICVRKVKYVAGHHGSQ